jgi:hypothetical protein
MNAITNCNAYWNRKIKKFTVLDLKSAQGWAMCGALIIAKLFPQILRLSIWWFVVPAIICSLRLVYTFWIKAGEPDQ